MSAWWRGRVSRAVTAVDEARIRECYALAREAVERGDHPFGALLVAGGEVVMRQRNAVVTERDVTRHAELALVSRAHRELGPAVLGGSTVYTSTEPCVMCAGALYWARVKEVVFGVPASELQRLAKVAFVIPSRAVLGRLEPRVGLVGPVLAAEGMEIHRRYWPAVLGS